MKLHENNFGRFDSMSPGAYKTTCEEFPLSIIFGALAMIHCFSEVFFLLRHTQSLPIQLICFSIDLRSPALSRVPPPERMAQKSCKQSKFSYNFLEKLCQKNQPVDNEGLAAFLCLTFKLLGTHRAIPQPLLSTKPPEILSQRSQLHRRVNVLF